MYDLLAIGETMVQVVPLAGGALDQQSTFMLRTGGAESNVAGLVARLGHSTAWVSWLGDDPFGSLILQALGSDGIDISHARICTGMRTGVFFKEVRDGKTTVHYYRDASAASQMDESVAEKSSQLRAQILHVSGITPALSAGCRALMARLVHGRGTPGALISFDVNYRPSLWSTQKARELLLELANAADIVFVGLDEAEHLWGTRTAAEVRALVPHPAHLVVKDAGRDATAFERDAVETAPAHAVQVIDTVGAGDAFAAGWLSAFLDGYASRDRLRLGHLIAAQVLGNTTDSAELPDRTAIQEYLGGGTITSFRKR